MGYDTKNAKEEEHKGILPKDDIIIGVVIVINDGTPRQFISENYHKEWKGNLDNPAIEVVAEVVQDGKKILINKVMPYKEEDGVTVYSSQSNIGKYKKKYGKLPEVGDQVKIVTDDNGFGKIKID